MRNLMLVSDRCCCWHSGKEDMSEICFKKCLNSFSVFFFWKFSLKGWAKTLFCWCNENSPPFNVILKQCCPLFLPVSVWLTVWTVLWAKSIILSTLNDRKSSSSRAMSPRKAAETHKQGKHVSAGCRATQDYEASVWAAQLPRALPATRAE